MPFSTAAKETNVTFKQKYLISAFGDLQWISLINGGLPRSVSLLRTRWSPPSTQSIKYDWRKKRFKNFELHPRRKSNYPCGSRWGVPVTPRPPVYHAADYSWACQLWSRHLCSLSVTSPSSQPSPPDKDDVRASRTSNEQTYLHKQNAFHVWPRFEGWYRSRHLKTRRFCLYLVTPRGDYSLSPLW